jgi:exopolyphosphatase/guanosine-5'-triphosphate,3'-diphosphate pyrophosphatase
MAGAVLLAEVIDLDGDVAGHGVHHGNLPASFMRCACIDIGSNTTRLLVAEAVPERLVVVLQQRVFTHIGRRLAADGIVPDATIAEVAEVVAAQRAAAASAGAERLRVVATAAIRRAGNRGALVDALRARAGVELTILSGTDEARLAFLGATRTLEVAPSGRIAVVDVGGGSTEIAIGTMAGGVVWSASVAVGSASLAYACREDPPSPADLATMREHARRAFAATDVPPAEAAVAVGGSAASLPKLVGAVLDGPALERALGVLAAASAADVAARHGIAAERAKLLPAGILVLGAAAQRLGRPLTIGRGGLREGIILELAARG